jgi:hypothetical protein
MSTAVDLLVTHVWWRYDSASDWYAQPYHWLNLVEGCLWLVCAALVIGRYLRHRRSPLELAYAAAFFAFGLSDFREAYVLESWLIGAKGVNLAILLLLRRTVMRRFYPDRRTI